MDLWRGPYIYLEPEEELDPSYHEALKKELTFDFVNERALLFGSPDDVVAKILKLHRETSIDQVIFRCAWPGLPHEEAIASIKRLRDEVIPRVNSQIAMDADSEMPAAGREFSMPWVVPL